MDLPEVFAGLDRYDTARDVDDHSIERVLPEDLGLVHAVNTYMRVFVPRMAALRNQPMFLNSREYKASWCGRWIKVVLPVMFDPGDPDACPDCANAVVSGTPRPKPQRPLDDYDYQWINDSDREQIDRDLDERERRLAEAESDD